MNYYDLNRIEHNIRETRIYFRQKSYISAPITYNTNWTRQSDSEGSNGFPVLSEMQRILDNEQSMINSFFVYSTTPELPKSMENLTIYDVNNMERILYDMNLIVKSIDDTAVYCGALECGG